MKILVVEDDEDIRNFLISAFRSECFEVDTAADGERGAYLARTNDYDIVVLDYMLPKKTGLEVCKAIRIAGKKMPILMLSARTETDLKIGLLEAGADDYLIKPYSFGELLARVRALLRRSSGAAADEILEAEDIKMDIKKQMVWRGKKEICLTRKEFMLLELLIKNRDSVVTRAKILEHVWDEKADPFSNTMDMHIANLRKKINSAGKKELIRTVSGRGYIID